MTNVRRCVLACLSGLAALATTGGAPAGAHEEVNPQSVPTGKPVFFTLSAANEKTADLTSVTLAAPDGVAFGAATREPPGWSVNRTDALVKWSGGAVKPDHFEQWGYEIEGADQPGTSTYRITLGYGDGTNDQVEVPVTVVAAGTPPSTAGGAPTTGAGVPPVTAVARPGGPAAAATGAAGSARTRANVALVVGGLALLAAGAALLRSVASRPAAASGKAADAQDW